MLTLRIGFPATTPEDDAVAAAVSDWQETAANVGGAAGDPTTVVIRDDPGRTTVGEYLVEVRGECRDG